MAVLTFNGAAQEVTGSCYLLESPACGRILLDCGIHQGGDLASRTSEEKFPFNPAQIDHLVLSHAHLDHSGLIPMLVKQGFRGNIYCTRATSKLLRIMLEDSAGIYEKDLVYENLRRKRRGDKPLKPAYTKRDVKTALGLCKPIRYRECLMVSDDFSICFHDAGHILGSAITELKLTEQGVTKTLVFSGDLGKQNSVLMNDPARLTKADIVLMEGTYGNRDHRSLDASILQLEQVLHETWRAHGSVMIPAFAVGRTQEILFYLGMLQREGRLDNWQIFLDSPMAIEITKIYESCIDILDPEDSAKLRGQYGASMQHLLPNLRYAESTEESMAINRIKQGAIIIAGSGMCTGGRIRHHFKQRIWDKHNTVIFAGFQARGTLGRSIVDGAKHIHMFGNEFRVGARIETLGGFSAHAGQSELIDWICSFDPPPRVMLLHGESDTLDTLSIKLWQDKSLATEIPYQGQKIHF
jgi:metallo-beta-lactamase family protein